jgi:hypothetical protein
MINYNEVLGVNGTSVLSNSSVDRRRKSVEKRRLRNDEELNPHSEQPSMNYASADEAERNVNLPQFGGWVGGPEERENGLRQYIASWASRVMQQLQSLRSDTEAEGGMDADSLSGGRQTEEVSSTPVNVSDQKNETNPIERNPDDMSLEEIRAEINAIDKRKKVLERAEIRKKKGGLHEWKEAELWRNGLLQGFRFTINLVGHAAMQLNIWLKNNGNLAGLIGGVMQGLVVSAEPIGGALLTQEWKDRTDLQKAVFVINQVLGLASTIASSVQLFHPAPEDLINDPRTKLQACLAGLSLAATTAMLATDFFTKRSSVYAFLNGQVTRRQAEKAGQINTDKRQTIVHSAEEAARIKKILESAQSGGQFKGDGKKSGKVRPEPQVERIIEEEESEENELEDIEASEPKSDREQQVVEEEMKMEKYWEDRKREEAQWRQKVGKLLLLEKPAENA